MLNGKLEKLLLSEARNKMCPHLILNKDQFRGTDFFFFEFSTVCLHFQLSLSPFFFERTS